MATFPNLFYAAAAHVGRARYVALTREWAGFTDMDSLWVDTPDARRGQARILDLLYVLGLRHPLLPVVSADYLDWLERFWRFQNPTLGEGDLAAVLTRTGLLPQGWPHHAMSGRAFRRLVEMLEDQGNVILPRLARAVMPGAELDRLFAAARDAGLTPAEMGDMLVDFGGGVFSERHLDQAGFDRIEVAIEAKIAGLWSPETARP